MLLGVPICFGPVYYDANPSLNAVLPVLTRAARHTLWAFTAQSLSARKISATFFAPLGFTYSAEKGVRLSAINQFLDGGDLQCAISKLWVCSFQFSPYFRFPVVAGAVLPPCSKRSKQALFSPWERIIRRFRACSPFKSSSPVSSSRTAPPPSIYSTGRKRWT